MATATVIATFALPTTSSAQSLRLSSASAAPGDSVAIEIKLTSPDGSAPQLLQWATTISTAKLSFVDDQLTLGPVARASDKSITCAAKTNTSDTRTLTCILAGGLKTIPNGVVAWVRLRIVPNAPEGVAQIKTERAVAVLKGLKEVPLPPAETTVSISSAKSSRPRKN